MIKLFKRSHKEPKKIKSAEIEIFTNQIQSNRLIYTRPSKDFYERLINLMIPDFLDLNNPIHEKFKLDFREQNIKLSTYFSDLLESGFDKDLTDRFYNELEKIIEKGHDIQFCIKQTIIFWFQLLKNLDKEMISRNYTLHKSEYDNLKIKIESLWTQINKD